MTTGTEQAGDKHVPSSDAMPDAVLTPRTEKHAPRSWASWRRLVYATLTVGACLCLIAALASLRSEAEQVDGEYVYFTVRKGDLPITVTERGALESQNDVEIICEVDDVQGDGIDGTPILWIIENGKSVKKGDPLVELDAASHLERLDRQILETEQARAKEIQARVNYENRITRNQTAQAKALLDVELDGLALNQYEDENGGTYQIEVQTVELSIQEQEARQEIEDRNLAGVEQLHALGYKSKGDLAQAELRALRANSALRREEAEQTELTRYDYRMKRMSLEGKRDTAKRNLKQVEVENGALLAQAKAWKDSAELSLKREEERLARYREQLEKCKIDAPQDGMVAYYAEPSRWGHSSSISEGTPVHNQQKLMTIPDLNRMQVKTAVHESVVDRVKTGLTATIRLDAFPDRIYRGKIESVAVLPDPGGWLASDTKVYPTIVTVDDEVANLKPGMTTVVEMHIDYLRDVLTVPLQAIVQRGDQTWCYVAEKDSVRQQPIKLGQTNDKFVEITEGLRDGDCVVLNTAAILSHETVESRKIAPDAKSGDGTSLH